MGGREATHVANMLRTRPSHEMISLPQWPLWKYPQGARGKACGPYGDLCTGIVAHENLWTHKCIVGNIVPCVPNDPHTLQSQRMYAKGALQSWQPPTSTRRVGVEIILWFHKLCTMFQSGSPTTWPIPVQWQLEHCRWVHSVVQYKCNCNNHRYRRVGATASMAGVGEHRQWVCTSICCWREKHAR